MRVGEVHRCGWRAGPSAKARPPRTCRRTRPQRPRQNDWAKNRTPGNVKGFMRHPGHDQHQPPGEVNLTHNVSLASVGGGAFRCARRFRNQRAAMPSTAGQVMSGLSCVRTGNAVPEVAWVGARGLGRWHEGARGEGSHIYRRSPSLGGVPTQHRACLLADPLSVKKHAEPTKNLTLVFTNRTHSRQLQGWGEYFL
eukprot:gene22665-biopygen7221